MGWSVSHVSITPTLLCFQAWRSGDLHVSLLRLINFDIDRLTGLTHIQESLGKGYLTGAPGLEIVTVRVMFDCCVYKPFQWLSFTRAWQGCRLLPDPVLKRQNVNSAVWAHICTHVHTCMWAPTWCNHIDMHGRLSVIDEIAEELTVGAHLLSSLEQPDQSHTLERCLQGSGSISWYCRDAIAHGIQLAIERIRGGFAWNANVYSCLEWDLWESLWID